MVCNNNNKRQKALSLLLYSAIECSADCRTVRKEYTEIKKKETKKETNGEMGWVRVRAHSQYIISVIVLVLSSSVRDVCILFPPPSPPRSVFGRGLCIIRRYRLDVCEERERERERQRSSICITTTKKKRTDGQKEAQSIFFIFYFSSFFFLYPIVRSAHCCCCCCCCYY